MDSTVWAYELQVIVSIGNTVFSWGFLQIWGVGIHQVLPPHPPFLPHTLCHGLGKSSLHAGSSSIHTVFMINCFDPDMKLNIFLGPSEEYILTKALVNAQTQKGKPRHPLHPCFFLICTQTLAMQGFSSL